MIWNLSSPEDRLRNSKTSCLRTRPPSFVLARFFSIASVDCLSSSTKRTDAAPRLSASIPSAPLPAQRSSTRASLIAPPKLEIVADRSEKLTSNLFVDRELRVELQLAVKRDRAGCGEANIRRPQDQLIDGN